MKEAFEKIVERLEEYEYNDLIEHNSELCEHCKRIDCGIGMDCSICVMDKAQEIVQEVAEEYNNGWIPCSERLPEEPEEGLTDLDECDEYIAMIENADIPTALNYAGNGEWYRDGEFYKVIAWQPLPEPYKETIERTGEIQ